VSLNQFYTVGKTPEQIIRCRDDRYFLQKYDWHSARERAKLEKLKVFFVDFEDNEASDDMSNEVFIEEVPPEFLNIKDHIDKYETSVNYEIAGQFFTSELAWRARKRLFTWDMYVYRLPHGCWLPAREDPLTREILENYFPLKTGDTGPAGGIIIACGETLCDSVKHHDGGHHDGGHCVEAAPVDAGVAGWQEAERLCREFSLNGINGWRLPSVDELKLFAAALRSRLRERENVFRTTETVFNWSAERNGETAAAVVTQENEDSYQYPYAYPMGGVSGGYHASGNGPYRGDVKEFPVTHCLPVRPARDFFKLTNSPIQ